MPQFMLLFYVSTLKSAPISVNVWLETWDANIMKTLDIRKTAPICVNILLFHLEICANFCKSIFNENDNDKTMRTGNVMEAKDTSETAPIYVKVLLLHLKICANICKSVCNDNDKTRELWLLI